MTLTQLSFAMISCNFRRHGDLRTLVIALVILKLLELPEDIGRINNWYD